MTPTETLRDALIACRREHKLIEMSSQPIPAGLQEGLAIQAQVARAMGHAESGWKVAIAEDGTPLAGLMPGPYLKPGEVYDGAIGAELRIEIELGLRLARDVAFRPDQAYDRAELLGHCDRAFLGVEIVESRFANWVGAPMPLWLTDAMGHGGYVIGPDLDIAVLDDVAGLGCFISLNGVTLYDQPAVHGNGDPMAPFLAWANRKHDFMGGLKAGQIVTTGSLCGGVLSPGKGQVLAKLTPLAEVALTLR